ncbi:MAG: hypothetical protein K5746_07235 [Clostridiales bacterium]|nr:hypothetical protein [Clostridiales bacterium]
MRMTEEEFENERRYQMLMYHVKRMLRSGIISEEEFLEIDTRYRQKYRPKSGGLSVRKDLLIKRKRVMNSDRKEVSQGEN